MLLIRTIMVSIQDQCEYDEALAMYEECLSIRLKKLEHDHPNVAFTYRNLGKYTRSKGHEKALIMYERSLSIRWLAMREKVLSSELKKLGDDHPHVAITYSKLASVYECQGKYDEALAMYEKCLSIRLEKLGHDHPDVAKGTTTWLEYTRSKASTRKRWQCTRRF